MTSHDRQYSKLDQICLRLDQAVRAISGKSVTSARPYPGLNEPEPMLTPKQRQHVAGLMRVNHAGEVCAQALYHGQALASRSQNIQVQMQIAADEEADHLAWCHQRILELGSHASYLNPLWYAGSFVIGATAGIAGDRWSLGFVAETEYQVLKHLENHLNLLPKNDQKSAKILLQMQSDEAHHRQEAIQSGAANLPSLIKNLMRLTSKLMVKMAYWF